VRFFYVRMLLAAAFILCGASAPCLAAHLTLLLEAEDYYVTGPKDKPANGKWVSLAREGASGGRVAFARSGSIWTFAAKDLAGLPTFPIAEAGGYTLWVRC